VAEFLGLGITHYPPLAGTNANMAGLLRWTLADPDIPGVEKDPVSWPAPARAEWSDDGGMAAAGRHRAELTMHLARCRQALDLFVPDVVVVWGDDQYENFREEVVPPFCVLAYEDVEVRAFAYTSKLDQPNAWGLPDDLTITIRGAARLGRTLAGALMGAGFDVAYSYKPRGDADFPHAIVNTQVFLDYEDAGRRFPYPILPVTVNCYGQHVIARRGGLARFADIAVEDLDPVGPSPERCFALGAAVARALEAGDLRVALVASSSWSHAFLCDRTWHVRPDTVADRRLYDALAVEDWAAWQKETIGDIVEAGQHEMLNWFCLAGAVAELRLPLRWSTFVATDVFNSNKCFAIFG